MSPSCQIRYTPEPFVSGIQTSEELGGRFGYLLFFLLGGWEGGVRGARWGGGVSVVIENPRHGGVCQERGRETEGPGGCLQGIWGGGAKSFFFGAEIPTKRSLMSIT